MRKGHHGRFVTKIAGGDFGASRRRARRARARIARSNPLAFGGGFSRSWQDCAGLRAYRGKSSPYAIVSPSRPFKTTFKSSRGSDLRFPAFRSLIERRCNLNQKSNSNHHHNRHDCGHDRRAAAPILRSTHRPSANSEGLRIFKIGTAILAESASSGSSRAWA